MATHSPVLLVYPRAKIYHFSQIGISEVKYEDPDHYAITKDFLNHQEQVTKVLME
ncbi:MULTISPECIES: hypothetical protein [Pseudoalteromonas]|uniref:Uncharacterized protein n=1 Tax=Pseudoalteromonas luteoviolacea (strain 2ta16) TaxID=1353533 RepID=V4HPL9_PSEL2|nr:MULTISPECIES: hypothetical protein [Pseudoalteromonas]ESP91743.1 hypothetical protein PL2TA16_05384 [Pseudoalteromonas luteoviolacea 2ta16]KZN40777.1 hypothetical protein N483_16750 [Pseudoalteromonas luteoviolacea NCIMB 1944]MCG7546652.1 hypothetical protein [Pseudoalteromonas sp. Of7M-16]